MQRRRRREWACSVREGAPVIDTHGRVDFILPAAAQKQLAATSSLSHTVLMTRAVEQPTAAAAKYRRR
jgi:hypothetical protein